MTKILARAAALVAVTYMLSGCANVMWQPIPGFIYSEASAPFEAAGGDLGTKHGTAMMTSVLGIVATGDATIETAAKSAGITRITHVDFKAKSILGVYAEFTVHVYGE